MNRGWDSIFVYDILKNGTAKLLSINLSPEKGDGPRNVYPSKNGKYLYVVCYILYPYKQAMWANCHTKINEHSKFHSSS